MSNVLKVIGIDASRIRSGGAVIHAMNIIENLFINRNIKIHVWLPKKLSRKVKRRKNLILHSPSLNEKNIYLQLWWQKFLFTKELNSLNVDLLFTLDASTLSSFQPQVVLSQDLLAYDRDLVSLYRYSKSWWRLKFIKLIQNNALFSASGTIFLSEFASNTIGNEITLNGKSKIIPHGVSPSFRSIAKIRRRENNTLKAVYVSPIAEYKNQVTVVEAALLLHRSNHDIEIDLIGGAEIASKNYLSKLQSVISKAENLGAKVRLLGNVPNDKLHLELKKYDLFIFASSIENLPITLLEAMSAGLPIASSSSGPMPEILKNFATYFDPNSAMSIKEAIELYINESSLIERHSKKMLDISSNYTWSSCVRETEAFLEDVWNNL